MEKKREEKKDAGKKKRREKGRRPLLEKLLWRPPRPPVWSLECSRYNLIEIHCYQHPPLLEDHRGRICKAAIRGHLHSRYPASPSRLRTHRHLQQTLTISNYGPKPRNIAKGAPRCLKTAEKFLARAMRQQQHRSYQSLHWILLVAGNRTQLRSTNDEAIGCQKSYPKKAPCESIVTGGCHLSSLCPAN